MSNGHESPEPIWRWQDPFDPGRKLIEFHGPDGEPLDFDEWARLWHSDDWRRIVRQERIGPFFVSTVWTGMDMGFGRSHVPLTYETMIFGPEPLDGWQVRAPTRASALVVHREATVEAEAAAFRWLVTAPWRALMKIMRPTV